MREVEHLLPTITSADLIAELRRRNRLRTVSHTVAYFNDLEQDDWYMEAMDRDLLASLVRALENKHYVRSRDRVIARDRDDRPVRTARYASLIILVPEEVEDGDATGLQRLRGATRGDQGAHDGDCRMVQEP